MNENNSKMTTREWIFLLVVISLAQFIIHASAFVYYGKGSALTYWSLIGTSISIILALLAIIWSFIQNLIQQNGSASIASQIDRLQSVVIATTKSGEQFSNQLGRLEEIRTQLQETSTLTRQSRDDIATMGKQVEATQRLIENLAHKPSEPPQSPGVATGDHLAQFYYRSSLTGAAIVYVCYLAHKQSVGFDLNKVCQTLHYIEQAYAHGYLVASVSAGVMEFTEAGGIITVSSFSATVSKDIRSALFSKVNSFKESNSELVCTLTKNIEAVEAMLSAK